MLQYISTLGQRIIRYSSPGPGIALRGAKCIKDFPDYISSNRKIGPIVGSVFQTADLFDLEDISCHFGGLEQSAGPLKHRYKSDVLTEFFIATYFSRDNLLATSKIGTL